MKNKDVQLLEEAYQGISKLEMVANLAYNLIDVPERHEEALLKILKLADPRLYKEIMMGKDER